MISHPALFFLNFRERVHDLCLPHRVRSEQDVNDNAQTIRRSRWWNYRNNNDFRNHIGFGGRSDILCSEIQEMSSRSGDGDIWKNRQSSLPGGICCVRVPNDKTVSGEYVLARPPEKLGGV